MATEEDYKQESYIPDHSQFETKLSQLYGRNHQQEACITVAVCTNIHSEADCMDLINAGHIKIDKKKGEEIKAAIKSYYQKIARSKKYILNDAYGNQIFKDSVNELKDKMNNEFQQLSEFRRDYLENAQLIQQVFLNGQDHAHEVLKKKQLQDICLRQSIKLQFIREAQSIIKGFYPKSMDITDAAEDIAETLEFQCFQTGAMKSIKNDSNKLRIINIIQKLRSFTLLQQFGGEQIEILKHKFTVEFYEKFCNILHFSLIRSVLDQLLRNPEYNWTNRSDINEDQNRKLIEQLWLKQNSLLKLMKAFKTKETLQNRIKKQVKTITYFITNTCKINLGAEEFETIKKYLASFNLVGFFDQNTSISPSMKRIYEFMNKNCPNYMKALINQEKCSVKLRTQKQLLLKKKLYEKIDFFSYKNWSELEDEILKGNANIIDKYIHDEDVRYELSVWIRTTMQDYYQIILKTETLKNQASSELMSFLINQNIKNLDYKDIVNIKEKLLRFPYQDYIQTNIKICFEDQSKIRKAFPTLKILSEYRKSKKIELSVLRQSAKMKIEPAINRLNHQNPTPIPTTLKKKLIDAFLDYPLASSIYEQIYVPQSYRRDFISAVNKIEEVQRYIEGFDQISCIEKENKLIDSLSQFMKPSDIETLKPYIFVFGEMPISNDGRFNVELRQQKYEELALLLKSLSSEDRNRLKQFEKSQIFQSFKEDLSIISELYKSQCWEKFLLLVERLIISKQLPEDEQKKLISVFQSKKTIGCDKIFSDQTLQSQRYYNLKLNLSNQPKYLHLLLLESSMNQNQQKFMELKLRKKIRSAYHHQSLMTISRQDKKVMITGLQREYKTDIIRQNTKLTEDSKKDLINYIQSSKQFRDFYKIPVQNVQPLKSHLQPVSSSLTKVNTTKANIPINPENKENGIGKGKDTTAIVEQPRTIEQLAQPIAVQLKAPVEVPKVVLIVNEYQPANQVEQFLMKWDKILLESKPRSQYRMARDSEFKQTPLKLVEHVLRSYPWSEEKINFWIAANAPTKSFMKRGLVSELNAFLNNNELLKEQIVNFQKQA